MKLLLRLDDGSLIGNVNGDDLVSKLTADEAQEQGRLGEADKQRIVRLLENFGGGLDPQPSSKRKSLETREPTPLDAKRSRPRQANGKRTTSDHSLDGSWSNQNWPDKCREILQKLLDSLGVEKQWFDRPVDEYYIPGYYSRVKNPMDLGTMSRKLDHGKYKGPQGFCEVNKPLKFRGMKRSCKDMRLVWGNCIFFNGKGTKYGKIGDRMSSYFEELWAASGLDMGSNRHRRSTAGVAAAKYEPQEESEQKRPIRKQPSTRTAATSKTARAPDEDTTIPMDRQQMQQLAEWMGEIDGDVLEGAINIIRERGVGAGSGEEIELDFDTMDNETLWALDDYMMQSKGGRRDSVGKANSGFQVEPESDYDESESDASED